MASDLEKKAKEAFIDDHFELAVDLYTQAIFLSPKNAELFADRAQANYKLEKFTEAVADANRAIELDPAMPKACLRKATACMKLEEYETAKAALEAGASLAPEDLRFTNLLKGCEERIAEETGDLPNNSSEKVPTDGTCKFGSNRKFNHPARRRNQAVKEKVKEREEPTEKPGQTECKYYLRTGWCKYGKACRFNHSRSKTPATPIVELNFLGLPIRPGEKECPYYMCNGSCESGDNCRFNHPDPTAVGEGDRPSGYGNGGSVSSQVASQEIITSQSSSRPSNETAPPTQGDSSQSPEWNGYQTMSKLVKYHFGNESFFKLVDDIEKYYYMDILSDVFNGFSRIESKSVDLTYGNGLKLTGDSAVFRMFDMYKEAEQVNIFVKEYVNAEPIIAELPPGWVDNTRPRHNSTRERGESSRSNMGREGNQNVGVGIDSGVNVDVGGGINSGVNENASVGGEQEGVTGEDIFQDYIPQGRAKGRGRGRGSPARGGRANDTGEGMVRGSRGGLGGRGRGNWEGRAGTGGGRDRTERNVGRDDENARENEVLVSDEDYEFSESDDEDWVSYDDDHNDEDNDQEDGDNAFTDEVNSEELHGILSDCDSENSCDIVSDGELAELRKSRNFFYATMRMGGREWKRGADGKFSFQVGDCFPSVMHVRKALWDYAVNEGYGLYREKNDSVGVTMYCLGDGCSWRIRVSRLSDNRTFMVKTLQGEHSCVRPVKHAQSFKKLPKYAELVRRKNPGSVVTLNLEGGKVFKRIFVSYKAVIIGFLAGCRPFIGLDGAFLKGPYKGCLLSAVALDGNNGIYPLAVAIVEGETKDAWLFFLEQLHACIRPGSDLLALTFMSDKQKGLIDAVRDIFPNACHRHCARHLYNNFKGKFPGLQLRIDFWKVVRASNGLQYTEAMKELKSHDKDAHDWLIGMPPSQWSRFEYDHVAKSDHVTNNFTKSFNHWVGKFRNKPILTLLENIRIKLMSRIHKRYTNGCTWEGKLTPNTNKKLDKTIQEARQCKVVPAGKHEFNVFGFGKKYCVDLDKKTCTCQLWGISGIPCKHATACIGFRRCNLEDYCDEMFTVAKYLASYSEIIHPLPEEELDPINENESIEAPKIHVKPCRPQCDRRMEVGEEGPSTQIKRSCTVRCRKCGQLGHNKRGCKADKSKPYSGSNPVHLNTPTHESGTTSAPPTNPAPTVRGSSPSRVERNTGGSGRGAFSGGANTGGSGRGAFSGGPNTGGSGRGPNTGGSGRGPNTRGSGRGANTGGSGRGANTGGRGRGANTGGRGRGANTGGRGRGANIGGSGRGAFSGGGASGGLRVGGVGGASMAASGLTDAGSSATRRSPRFKSVGSNPVPLSTPTHEAGTTSAPPTNPASTFQGSSPSRVERKDVRGKGAISGRGAFSGGANTTDSEGGVIFGSVNSGGLFFGGGASSGL